jgi:hypothetical protein
MKPIKDSQAPKNKAKIHNRKSYSSHFILQPQSHKKIEILAPIQRGAAQVQSFYDLLDQISVLAEAGCLQ